LLATDLTEVSSVSLDPVKTAVRWELAGNMHTTHGTFKLKEGKIQIDPTKGTVSGSLVIDARSGESGNAARDRRMHREIIESEKYPEIRFTPERLEGAVHAGGGSNVKISGWLELHGARHQMTIPAEVKISSKQVTSTLRFEVPYVDWGMKDPSTFVFRVDKKVTIEVEASGTLVSSDQ
jgi:polyisoprenoid-binding protein YceI